MGSDDNDTTGRRGAADLTIRAPRRCVSGLRRRHVQVAIGGVAAAVAAALVVGLGIDFRPCTPRDEAKVVPRGDCEAGPAPLADLPSTYAEAAIAATRPARSVKTVDAVCSDCTDASPRVPAVGGPRDAPTVTRQADLTQAMQAIRQVGEQNQRLAAQLAAYQGEFAKRQEKAWASGLFFKVDDDHATPAVQAVTMAATAHDPTNAPRASTTAPGQPTDQDRKLAFLAEATAPGVALDRAYLRPGSANQLQAGTVIPAALLTGINTDLPGDVVAAVTAPVYRSRTGRTLLVPQGARLYGGYDSHIGTTQNRVLLVWHRLLMPNGRSVELDRMRGTDAAGYAGVADAVDYHADQLALGAALSGAIAYAGNLARNTQTARTTAGDTIGDTVAQEAGRTGSRIVDRQLDQQPTVTVRPGWPVRVLVDRDVTLEPYEN